MDSLFIFRHCIFGTISRDSSESMIYLGGGQKKVEVLSILLEFCQVLREL